MLSLAAVVAALSLPYWLAAAVRPLLRAHGVEWRQHENRWRTLSLEQVTFKSETVTVSAASVSLSTPWFWLAGLLRRDPAHGPYVTVEDWTVIVTGTSDTATEDRILFLDVMDQVGRGWNTMARWLPSASFRNGSVRLAAAEGLRLDIPEFVWLQGSFQSAPRLCTGDGAVLVSADVEALMRWPAHGRLRLKLAQEGAFPPGPLPTALAVARPEGGRLMISGGWDRGPVSFTVRQEQSFRLHDDVVVETRLSMDGGITGIELRAFEAWIGGATVLHADGRVPVVITPGSRENPILLHRDEPFRLRASTVPDAGFWSMLDDVLPVRFLNPVLFADLDGTVADLRGRVRLTADQVVFPVANGLPPQALPPVTGLRVEVKFSEESAVLERLGLKVAGQVVEATASLPLGGDVWRDLFQKRQLPHWSRLHGTLRAPNVEIAAFSAYVPALVAPVGVVSADLRFEPGAQLFGKLELREAATRPIMPLGTISSMRGGVHFNGRSLTVTNLAGVIGDRELSVTGDARLRDDFGVDYTLRLTGDNVPVIRRPGLMLRGDLDVTAAGSVGEQGGGRISGRIRLRKGYYLSELRLPGGEGNVTVPAQRPPFFSVEAAPFADWTLDLAIGGDGFMQVRSPVFNGLLSADFHLGGTLREPLSPGQLTIDRGRIRFPFATLDIERGTVLLTHENPYHAQLQVMSSGRVFGYDIRMDLGGPAEDPTLTFSATPPLSSEAVLMMITAGELPEREIAFTGQQRAARMALFLGQHLLYELTGDENVGDNLVIEGGRNISRQGKETYAIRYRLSDRLSLTGEYDEYDAINAGIRLRVFSR